MHSTESEFVGKCISNITVHIIFKKYVLASKTTIFNLSKHPLLFQPPIIVTSSHFHPPDYSHLPRLFDTREYKKLVTAVIAFSFSRVLTNAGIHDLINSTPSLLRVHLSHCSNLTSELLEDMQADSEVSIFAAFTQYQEEEFQGGMYDRGYGRG